VHKNNIVNFKKPTQAVVVKEISALSSLGDDISQITSAVYADISRFNDSNFYGIKRSAFKMSLIPEEALAPLDDEVAKSTGLTSRQIRLLKIVTNPLISIFEKSNSDTPLPLFLSGPEKLPDRRSVVSDQFLQLLIKQTKVNIDLKNSYIFPHGRAAGIYALEAAMQYLETNPGKLVIVGGVDSYLDPHLIGTLSRDDRLKTDGIMDGFIAGEGAAFLLISDLSQLDKNVQNHILHPPGIASEPGHLHSDEPYKGEGLSEAIKQSLNINLNDKVKSIVISFNGENFYAKEWGVASLRNSEFLDESLSLLHPADCFGDVGAAFAPLAIGISITGMLNNKLNYPALISCSSEMEQRGAVCLTLN
jgi:3-oxoacyl-[acyl-carrier-protein] synthase I